MFAGDSGDDKESPRGKGQGGTNAILNTAQMRELRETRKQKFLLDFNTSAKYLVLREKLKKAIFRVAIEKYKRTVP
jgi:hypothetical protein